MYVCMYICIYVCMYISINIFINSSPPSPPRSLPPPRVRFYFLPYPIQASWVDGCSELQMRTPPKRYTLTALPSFFTLPLVLWQSRAHQLLTRHLDSQEDTQEKGSDVSSEDSYDGDPPPSTYSFTRVLICLPFCLSACLAFFLFIYLSVYRYLSICLHVPICIYIFDCLSQSAFSVPVYLDLFACLLVRLSAHLSLCRTFLSLVSVSCVSLVSWSPSVSSICLLSPFLHIRLPAPPLSVCLSVSTFALFYPCFSQSPVVDFGQSINSLLLTTSLMNLCFCLQSDILDVMREATAAEREGTDANTQLELGDTKIFFHFCTYTQHPPTQTQHTHAFLFCPVLFFMPDQFVLFFVSNRRPKPRN
jgi:hypothetical protein